MRANGATHDAHTTTVRSAVVGIVALVATLSMTGVVEAASDRPEPDPDYPPSSDQGVDPELLQGGRDRKCDDLDPSFTDSAHVEAGEETDITYTLIHSEEEDDHEHEFPEGLTYEIDGSTVSWSSDFPIGAVIVKGGPNSYVYYYDPHGTSDGNLVTPLNKGNVAPDVSSIRFCWNGEPEDPPVELSCEDVPDTVELGPIVIVNGNVDQSSVPGGVTAVMPDTDGVAFVSEVPVAAAVIAASEPVTYPFDPEVLEGSVPAMLDGEAALLLCVREVSDDPGDDPSDDPSDDPGDDPSDDPSDDPVDATSDDPSDDPVDATSDDPVVAGSDPSTIPTGGGPSGRTAFLLVAFVVLALSASAGLLAWSRGG